MLMEVSLLILFSIALFLTPARLIDTIKFKGIKGAEAYMEVVEWVYPEVYCSITGRSPRDPPEGKTYPVLVFWNL